MFRSKTLCFFYSVKFWNDRFTSEFHCFWKNIAKKWCFSKCFSSQITRQHFFKKNGFWWFFGADPSRNVRFFNYFYVSMLLGTANRVFWKFGNLILGSWDNIFFSKKHKKIIGLCNTYCTKEQPLTTESWVPYRTVSQLPMEYGYVFPRVFSVCWQNV